MLKASTPLEENARLACLRQLSILDTPPEERFDRITRLLVHFYKMPIAAVSLIDSDRVWLKSKIGTSFCNIPREQSFCAHVVAANKMIVVKDTLRDERFFDNPFVTAVPHIRSYFGVPLIGPEGYPIGVLCMVDNKPRRLSQADINALISLAAIASNELAAVDINRAVTERARNEKWMRLLLNHLPDGVIMLNKNAIVEAYNPAAERLFGASPSGLIGIDAATLTKDDLSQFSPFGMDENGAYTKESTGRRIDGSLFPMEVFVTPMYLGGKKKFAVMVRDLATRKANEAQRLIVDERKQKFYSSAAHELRSPLSSMLGFANMLAKRQLSNETVSEIAGIMSTETTRLVNLINEMLDFARLENGGNNDFDVRVQSLVPVIKTTLQSLGGMAGMETVVSVIEPEMPDVAIDARKLQQALTNILSNAIKYSPNGGQIDIVLQTAYCGNARFAQISIKDRGIGMTLAQKERVFEPFYRARQLPSAQGTGLGMAITLDLIKLQGGSISVDSTLGKGTEVSIYFPSS